MNPLVLTISFLLLLTSCKEPNKKAFDFNTFPNDWVKLTEKDGKLVVFNSCDAGNLLLTITKNKAHFDLLLHGQQEDSDFEITETTQLNDTIYITAKWKVAEEKQEFKFVWEDKEKGLGRFVIGHSSGYTSNDVFVTKDKQAQFETVEQPCKECWGDECDDMGMAVDHSDIPIGVIKNLFEGYVKNEESTASQEDKDMMKKSIEALDRVTDPGALEILINVWMYYDPTDFPVRNLVFRILDNSRPESIAAVKTRIKYRKDWEADDTAPYSELFNLLQQMEK